MDAASFDQFSLTPDDVEDISPYMTENMEGVEALARQRRGDRRRDPRHGGA